MRHVYKQDVFLVFLLTTLRHIITKYENFEAFHFPKQHGH